MKKIKEKKIKNAFLISLAVFVLIVILAIITIFIVQDGGSVKLVADEEYQNLQSITIDAHKTDITVQRSASDKVYLEIKSRQKDNYQITNDNDNLKVTFSSSLCLLGCHLDEEVILYLPDNYQNNLYLSTTSGDIETIYLNTNASLITTSGDVDVHLAIKDFEIKTNTKRGEIDLSRKSIKGANNIVDITTTSGDIDVE